MRQSKLFIIAVTFTFISVILIGCAGPEPAPTPLSTKLPPSSYLPEVPRISAEEVKVKLDAGINLVIIDSRLRTNYAQAHIKGALSIPESTMSTPYSDLDGYDEIVTYCT